jgi:hypothetical protein
MKKELRIGIIASVLATILFIYFLDPLLRLLGRAVLRATGALATAYQNRLFREIATSRPDFAYFCFELLLLLSLLVLTQYTASVLRRYKRFARPRVPRDPTAALKRAHRYALALPLLIVFLCVLTLALLVDGNLRLRVATSFEQHITILAPHLTDQAQKELRARFASLRTVSDYLALQAEIGRIAAQNRVLLPENELYSVP